MSPYKEKRQSRAICYINRGGWWTVVAWLFSFLEFGHNFNFQCQCCAKSLALHKDSENSSSDKREMMKGEVLLLIISVALTVIVYILIVFIKKFIRLRPPGGRLVSSDIQVVVGNSKFRGSAT